MASSNGRCATWRCDSVRIAAWSACWSRGLRTRSWRSSARWPPAGTVLPDRSHVPARTPACAPARERCAARARHRARPAESGRIPRDGASGPGRRSGAPGQALEGGTLPTAEPGRACLSAVHLGVHRRAKAACSRRAARSTPPCARCASCSRSRPRDRVLQFASLNWDTCFEEILPTLTGGREPRLRRRGVYRLVSPFPAHARPRAGHACSTCRPRSGTSSSTTWSRSGPHCRPACALVIIGGEAVQPGAPGRLAHARHRRGSAWSTPTAAPRPHSSPTRSTCTARSPSRASRRHGAGADRPAPAAT